MDQLRVVTGYVAHAILALYWLWMLAATAPQLRRGCRDRGLRARVLALKTAGLVLTALVVGVIHYWATQWWQVVVCVPVAAFLGFLLHRAYRRLVAAPRHRLTLTRRARAVVLRSHRRGAGPPAHLRTEVGPAPVGPSAA